MSKRRAVLPPRHAAPPSGPSAGDGAGAAGAVAGLHLRFGWWALLLFLAMGLVLESLHGLKIDFYLNAATEVRRLLWTLSHAHGTLFALVNIAFAFTLRYMPGWRGASLTVASRTVLVSSLLMPVGFFLGGLWLHAGDPGLGILLVPVGGALMLVGVFLTARAATQRHAGSAPDPGQSAGRTSAEVVIPPKRPNREPQHAH